METKNENLMDGLLSELNRNRQLLQEYKNIGPAGMFGAAFIQQAITRGEQAIKEGDVIKMISAYSELKESQ